MSDTSVDEKIELTSGESMRALAKFESAGGGLKILSSKASKNIGGTCTKAVLRLVLLLRDRKF